jgi:hypothetical protein
MAQQTSSTADGFTSKGSFGLLTFGGYHRTIHYNSSNNLPILFLASDLSKVPSPNVALLSDTSAAFLSSTTSSDKPNLTSAQQRLLHLHQKLGHLTCDPPLCKACLHGKQHRSASSNSSGVLDTLHLSPGDCVSGDQLESTTPGLIPTFRGSPTLEKYHAGTLFVDHASRYLHFMPHISTGSQEAINAKHPFELHAFHNNCSIKCYHTDNGIFASKDFHQSCIQQKQRIKFCGVNAHHQNGIAERHNRTITERATTMLIHAMLSWPDIIQEQLHPCNKATRFLDGNPAPELEFI